MANPEPPYLETCRVVVTRRYNPRYGDVRLCTCGHPYHRHFDSFEEMEDAGCKYCQCQDFVEACAGAPTESQLLGAKASELVTSQVHMVDQGKR